MAHGDTTKILIVDDLSEKHLVYRVILEELEQEIVIANSGAEALKQVLKHDFAVILLDVNMPDMDGFETAALIRKRKRSAHTPIIFITAFVDEVRISEGYAHGAVDYILAPVVPEVLRAKVKVFVDLFLMHRKIERQAQEQIALAEERSRRTAAEEANRRLGYLARAGAVLGQSLDYQVTADDIARLCVPSLADSATVVPGDFASQDIKIVRFSTNGDHSQVEHFNCIDALPAPTAHAVQSVLDTGNQELLAPQAPTPGQADREMQPQIVAIPLLGREQRLAVLVLSREPSGRTFSPSDLTMADALASRAGVAMDNSRLYRDLALADRQKNEFLSMLAHELRNPLAPIRSAVAVLRHSCGDNPDLSRAHDVIDRQVTHLVRLVDDLLDVSRITRGKIDLKVEQVDVAEVIAAAVETSRPNIEALGHKLTVELPSEPLVVPGDQARLAQVLSNLLNNAAKFTMRGGTIKFSAHREGNDAVFSVQDSGIGIPPQMLDKIFDLFTQVDQSLDRSQGGLGIGLTLVQRLVELHGGRVIAQSEGRGKGSQFTVRLPAVAAHAIMSAPDSGGEELSVSGKGLRVLVVDDNMDAADSLAWLLRLSGHDTKTAYDGLAAVEEALAFAPQAVILDLGLPGIDGFNVAQRLRREPPTESSLLIALSGYGRDEDQRRSSEAGFDFHMVKPVDVNSLLEALSAGFPGDQPVTQCATDGT